MIQHTRYRWLLAAWALVTGCAMPALMYDLLPPVYEYSSSLAPISDLATDAGYEASEASAIVYDREGLRITVRHLSDTELNRRYPSVSYQDRFAANPFTYGNWRDPRLGYTPNRFTVFEIEVYNPILPKVELFPGEARLRTDQGDEYGWYSVNREESDRSLEDYYTLIRGPGGNEQYRFDQRMGIVREELYRPGHQVFKGGTYRGYLVFAPLSDEVKGADLHLKRFATQFDEANDPTQTMDLSFRFTHQVEKRQLSGEEARRARRRDWVLPAAAGGAPETRTGVTR
ncbi:MAG: hypothetical protein WDA75_02410 [Candidatus Latescibacterota bacterium]